MPSSAAAAEESDCCSDMYDDLENFKPCSKTSNGNNNTNGISLSLANQVKALALELKTIKEEKENLKQNMGTLFCTARAKI